MALKAALVIKKFGFGTPNLSGSWYASLNIEGKNARPFWCFERGRQRNNPELVEDSLEDASRLSGVQNHRVVNRDTRCKYPALRGGCNCAEYRQLSAHRRDLHRVRALDVFQCGPKLASLHELQQD
jgi:hypothetical protein